MPDPVQPRQRKRKAHIRVPSVEGSLGWPKSKPDPATDFVTIGPECFAGRVDGHWVICWKGENYEPQKTTLRVRFHNWRVRRWNERHA